MTQQVRKRYRNHRKAAWALVIGLSALIAAVVIPIASGASDKTYTLTVAPATVCSSPNGGQASTIVTIKNTAKSAQLGSAEISFPLNSIETVSRGDVRHEASTDVIENLNELNLAKNASAPITVTFKANVTFGPTKITAVVKQANRFNDSSGSANLFENPTFPSLTVETCTVKIEGTVYRDADGNGTGDSILKSAHTVKVTGGSNTQTTSTDESGKYSFDVPKGGTYTVCMASNPDEVQTKPNDVGTKECSSVDGYSLPGLTSASLTNDFAFAGGVTASCTNDGSGDPFYSQINQPDANATVVAKFTYYGLTCKAAQKQFVFTTYADGGSRVAKLSPVGSLGSSDCNLSTGVDCQVVVQKITWALTASSPELKTLNYDDTTEGGSSGVMKFCLKDPIDRSKDDGVTLLYGSDYLPDDILPGTESTCLIRTTQYGPPGSSTRVDEAYSAYDGKISFG
jgi:SdrD B-like domain